MRRPHPLLAAPKGFTYAVDEVYLEDILEATGYQPRQAFGGGRGYGGRGYGGRGRGGRGRGGRGRGNQRHVDRMEKEEEERAEYEMYLQSIADTRPPAVIDALAQLDFTKIDIDLVAATIRHICLHKGEGAILCFLPGWDEISKLHDL